MGGAHSYSLQLLVAARGPWLVVASLHLPLWSQGSSSSGAEHPSASLIRTVLMHLGPTWMAPDKLPCSRSLTESQPPSPFYEEAFGGSRSWDVGMYCGGRRVGTSSPQHTTFLSRISSPGGRVLWPSHSPSHSAHSHRVGPRGY